MDPAQKKSGGAAAKVGGQQARRNQAEHESMRREAAERSIQNRISLLHSRSTSLISCGIYEEALRLLDEIKSLQHFEDIGILLSMAECLYHIPHGRQQAENCVQRLRIAIEGNTRLTFEDILSWGNDLIEIGRYCGSIVIFVAALEKSKSDFSFPETRIEACQIITNNISSAVSIMKELKDISIAVFHVANKYLGDILHYVRDTALDDPGAKALSEAKCMNSIMEVYICAKEFREGVRLGLAAVKIMEEHLGTSAKNRFIYSTLHHNLGVAYFKQNCFALSEVWFCKVLIQAEAATDYPFQSLKDELILKTRSLLETICNMGNYNSAGSAVVVLPH